MPRDLGQQLRQIDAWLQRAVEHRVAPPTTARGSSASAISAASIVLPSHQTAARHSVFSSSRMLPG